MTQAAAPGRSSFPPLRRTLSLGLACAALLAAPSPAGADPDIAGALEGAREFRARPAHALFGRGLADRLLGPYDALRERARGQLGLDYLLYSSLLFQQGSEEAREDRALVGQLHTRARWSLTDHPAFGKGALGLSFVHVRQFLGMSASALSERSETSLAVNDADIDGAFTALQNLWWEQRLAEQRINLLVGQLDLQGLMNANTYADDDTFSFVAQPIATNPATAFPPAGLGAFVEMVPSDDWYLSLAFVDAHANGRYPDFHSFAKGRYVYAAELGLTPAIEGVGAGTYRLTGFHRDRTPSEPAAGGAALSFEQQIGSGYGLFLRYAVVDGGTTDLEQVLGAGVVLRQPLGRTRDWLGFAFMWGDLSDDSMQDQYGFETYWRLQLTERLEFTPDLQVHLHPSGRGSASIVGGLRLRILL
jgi:porin